MEINKKCPLCGSQLKEVPAGISKRNGNPYKAFIACENRECRFTCKPEYLKNIADAGGVEGTIQTKPNEIEAGINNINEKLQKIWDLLLIIKDKTD